MASLKEIKGRITSVKSTRKITSAMKMIASAKLRKAQNAITNFLPYQQKLDAILTRLLSSDSTLDLPFTEQREVKRIAIVVFSSNSSLCGAFNSNIIKEFTQVYKTKSSELGRDNILVYPVGKKITDAIKKQGITPMGDFNALADVPTYEDVQVLAKTLIERFVSKDVDEIRIINYHFKSAGTQILTNSVYLPFDLNVPNEEENVATSNVGVDYILEPSKDEIIETLVPVVLYSRMFAALLDSAASEHAARMMAMQTATDNADELIGDLTIIFNKTRQQAVTNELLDIIGGASALNG